MHGHRSCVLLLLVLVCCLPLTWRHPAQSTRTWDRYILGEAPEVRNFFVATGMNSSGIAGAGGAGMAIAEWIVGGEPSMDLWAVDIRRFGAFHDNKTCVSR